ncbi:uncharacterized protein METZ01_LOCUS209822, partial [marine metagenome]
MVIKLKHALVLFGIIIFIGNVEGQDSVSGLYSGQDWPFAGGDWSNSRYSTLADISVETVDRLNGAWVTRLEGGASSRSTPVV